MIAFLCAGCGKNLKVKDELAGRKGRCPHCQQPMRVPSAADAAGERADADDLSAADAKTVLPPALDAEMDTKTVLPAARGKTSAAKSGVGSPSGITAPKKTAAPASNPDAELYDFLSPPQAPDEIGRLGSYRVLKVLGAGGMGVVFQAEDPRLNRLVALKAMLPALAASGSNKERFLREARAAAAIEHDHIVAIFQVDEDKGVPFIAMPFLRGESLDDRLKGRRKLPIPEALRIAKETADGLAAAHDRDMIHRDIKPANIWLEGEKGRVKILDFGLARSASGESHLTQQGTIVGTPQYMAPEQGAGKSVDTRCDLFSLGCLLYRMTTGQLPFKGADTVSTLIAVATETPPAPRKLNPEMSPKTSKLIMDLLAKDPKDRPPSALSVVDTIEELEKEPSPDQTEVVEELVARVPAVRDEDDRVRRADELDEVQPAGRSLMLPLLLGGGVGVLALLGIGIIVIALFVKKDDKPDVASNTPTDNKPIENVPPGSGNPPAGVNDFGKDPKAGGNAPNRAPLAGRNDPGLNPGEEDPFAPRPKIGPRKKAASDADKTYKPYNTTIKNLLFTPDSTHFFSFGERNARVDFWEAATGKLVRSYTLGGGVRHCLLSPDGSRLIAYNDGGLMCWDVDSGRELAPVIAPQGLRIIGGGFTADKDVRAALSGRLPGGFGVVIYDSASQKLLMVPDPKPNKPAITPKTKKPAPPVPLTFPHPAEPSQVFFGPDAKQFLSWSQDRIFRTWDIEKMRLANTFPVAPGRDKSFALTGDFKRMLATFNEADVHLYDVEAGTETKTIKGANFGNTDAVGFGGENNNLCVCGSFGDVRVFDLESGEVKKELKAGGGILVTAVALSPDGKMALAGDLGGNIYFFNLDKKAASDAPNPER